MGWDFGENEKVVQNPSHTYQAPGTYTVKFTATNADGTIQATKSIPVTVTEVSKPAVAFTQIVPDASAPLIAQFTDQSTGSPSAWLWNFGDGQTSTEQNPNHTYPKMGIYMVFLTITAGGVTYSISKLINIQTGVITPPPADTCNPSTVMADAKATITLKGSGFKYGSKVRIIKPNLWGIAKVKTLSSTQIVFDFFFGPGFSGSCGVAVITSTGKSILFENVITVE